MSLIPAMGSGRVDKSIVPSKIRFRDKMDITERRRSRRTPSILAPGYPRLEYELRIRNACRAEYRLEKRCKFVHQSEIPATLKGQLIDA